eukprot:TRINITY_DN12356_c0_g1_i1.p1 TRINITY_DN12356_c0_g1~~TRINITY_DN12356_c0_g1_i1.p1  ORF type:complete len:263 (-),score=25.56 TRINITY_DN12356_c0_g1_i1:302-1090(-)
MSMASLRPAGWQSTYAAGAYPPSSPTVSISSPVMARTLPPRSYMSDWSTRDSYSQMASARGRLQQSPRTWQTSGRQARSTSPLPSGYRGSSSSYRRTLNLDQDRGYWNPYEHLEKKMRGQELNDHAAPAIHRSSDIPRRFPYHDPAFGCHFRPVWTTDDPRDAALISSAPDAAPPFGELLTSAKSRVYADAQRRNHVRRIQKFEHDILHELHLDYLQSGYDEVSAPLPFREQEERRNDKMQGKVVVPPWAGPPNGDPNAWWY